MKYIQTTLLILYGIISFAQSRGLQLKGDTLIFIRGDQDTVRMSKQPMKTINGNAVYGNGDITISGGAVAWSEITSKPATFTPSSHTHIVSEITDFPTTTASFTNSTNKNFVTDAQAIVIGNTAGTNTGDNATNSQYVNDFRTANFVAGTNYLAPNGNGSSLTGLTASQVGLANVNNTSDASKPVSTAQQTALDLKANLASPTFTGTVALPSATVYNTPTIGTSGSSGTSHIKTVGSIPTVAQTGLGSGGSPGVSLETGSTDAAGIITLATGNTSVGSTGTVTLTFNGAYSGNQPVIVLTLVKGATDWGALATVRQTTQSLTAPIFTWNNSATGAAAALSTGTTYKIAYLVIQK